MINPTEINVTYHAMLRWTERGYMGNDGLINELLKAKPLGHAAELDNDLYLFLDVVDNYYKNQSDTSYYYTRWFIFVLKKNKLITCILRRPRTQKPKPHVQKRVKSKRYKRRV